MIFRYFAFFILCVVGGVAGCNRAAPPVLTRPRPTNLVRLPPVLLSKTASQFGQQPAEGSLLVSEASTIKTTLHCADAESLQVARQPLVIQVLSTGIRPTLAASGVCAVSDGETTDDAVFEIEVDVNRISRPGKYRVQLIGLDRTLGETEVVVNAETR